MNENVRILVVDDERDHADGIAESLHKFCAEPIVVYNGEDALKALHDGAVDIVITELKLEGNIDGLTILRQAKKTDQRTEVILMTAYGTIDTCKEAIRDGAYDYLTKPIDIDQLRVLVGELCRHSVRVYSGKRQKAQAAEADFEFEGIRGKSSAMAGILEVLRRVAGTNIFVLIEGPSGSGKELLARAVHNNSARRNRPFRPVNCAGLSESLLESELFGHVKGAFTGAANDRKGLFEVADKGTLFLDEIGDMPLNMQAKLLRVLEDGIITPVGSNKQTVVDVRVISATNHDLAKLMEQKKFRQDLYFRIKGVSVTVPALYNRVEDIPVFVEYFARQAAAEIGVKITGMTESALAILMSYNWPGKCC